jgi:hypothetical protein
MLSTGTFPLRLKYAEIKPIFKKGDKNKMVNFRPISLLTSFSKVFEKVIYTRLYQHTTCNFILANEQFGFRTLMSTAETTHKLPNTILDALNN